MGLRTISIKFASSSKYYAELLTVLFEASWVILTLLFLFRTPWSQGEQIEYVEDR